MGIESIMYFALGLCIAGLLALMIMPAVWRRAVRLTKKRIEAATPMTMAEFRADKDQLRAEFAVKIRQLETTADNLRRRLSEQVGETSARRSDVNALQTDREQHSAIVADLEERSDDLRRRVLELEKENVDFAQRLRMRERDYDARLTELEEARKVIRGELVAGIDLDGNALSGDYDEDTRALLDALAIERKRNTVLEEQAQALVSKLDAAGKNGPADTGAVVTELRKALAAKAANGDGGNELMLAEARIASAESRLNALLEETKQLVDSESRSVAQSLAEKFSLEEQTARLRRKVGELEADAVANFDDAGSLRDRLMEIAGDVSRLVYTTDSASSPEVEESLFDRVQKFAADDLQVEEILVPPPPARKAPAKRGKVTDRMAAIRDIQRRG